MRNLENGFFALVVAAAMRRQNRRSSANFLKFMMMIFCVAFEVAVASTVPRQPGSSGRGEGSPSWKQS
jgi:hypothetical protein